MVSPEREELIGKCVCSQLELSHCIPSIGQHLSLHLCKKIHSEAKIETTRGQKLISEIGQICSLLSNNSISFLLTGKPDILSHTFDQACMYNCSIYGLSTILLICSESGF